MSPTIAGLPLGAFTVLVGQDDEALRQAMPCGPGDIYDAGRGVSDGYIRAGGSAMPLYLVDVFDSLHPTRIPAGMASLRAAGVPVVATTHNVYVLDACDPDEVLVLHDGQVARLSEHPQAHAVGRDITTGQLWRIGDEAAWVPAAVERRGR